MPSAFIGLCGCDNVCNWPSCSPSRARTAVLEKTVDATSFSEIVRGAVGPFETYCDGYGNPGANGTGYVSVMTLHVSKDGKKHGKFASFARKERPNFSSNNRYLIDLITPAHLKWTEKAGAESVKNWKLLYTRSAMNGN